MTSNRRLFDTRGLLSQRVGLSVAIFLLPYVFCTIADLRSEEKPYAGKQFSTAALIVGQTYVGVIMPPNAIDLCELKRNGVPNDGAWAPTPSQIDRAERGLEAFLRELNHPLQPKLGSCIRQYFGYLQNGHEFLLVTLVTSEEYGEIHSDMPDALSAQLRSLGTTLTDIWDSDDNFGVVYYDVRSDKWTYEIPH